MGHVRRTRDLTGHGKREAPWTEVQGASFATPTGLEPAASAVTGRRANQLRYGALLVLHQAVEC